MTTSPTTPQNSVIPPKTADDFTIPLAEAQNRINSWKAEQGGIITELQSVQSPLAGSPALSINAFTFQLSDICNMIERIYVYNNPTKPLPPLLSAFTAVNPVNAVRFYLGQKEDGSNCLVNVAVTGFSSDSNNGGQDFVNLPPIVSQPVQQSSIYDFSYPCPTTCPNPPSSGINNVNFNG